MANTYNNMSAQDLLILAATMSAVFGSPAGAAYGVPTDQTTALNTDRLALSAAVQTAANANADFHAAIESKEEKDLALVGDVQDIAKTVYANPNVTDEMLAAIGLAPRPSTRTRHQPQPPVDFIAIANVDGTVSFKWSKGANAPGGSYLIQQQTPSGWEIVKVVGGSKTTLANFTPGETVSFRVVASRSGVVSAPSNVSVIYPTGGVDFELKVA